MNRRGFIKALGLTAAATALPGTSAAAPVPELATLLDLSKCIGCGECVIACREANAHKFPEPKKPFPVMHPTSRVPVEDWSERREVDDRLTPYNWLYIQSAEVEYQGEAHEIHVPRRCMHCHNPPCANLCPWGAAYREENGIVAINHDICLGGAKCRTVCPWHIPQRQTGVGLYLDILPNYAGNGVLYKCDRCSDRVAQGLAPACIEACPEGVQTIGPKKDIFEMARELAQSMNGFTYGDKENGSTNTVYVSPVPFDLLDQAVKKGKGRPGLEPVRNMMAAEDSLAFAVLMAPVAGAAAGIMGAVSKFKKRMLEEAKQRAAEEEAAKEGGETRAAEEEAAKEGGEGRAAEDEASGNNAAEKTAAGKSGGEGGHE